MDRREPEVLTRHAEPELVWILGEETLEERALAYARRSRHDQRPEEVREGRHGWCDFCVCLATKEQPGEEEEQRTRRVTPGETGLEKTR